MKTDHSIPNHWILPILGASCLALLTAGGAETTTINFEGPADGTVISSQYRDNGIVFTTAGGNNLPVIRRVANPNPHYAPNNVADISVGAGEFPMAITRGEFSSPHTTLSMVVGYLGALIGTDTAQLTLIAYDPYGNVVAQAGAVVRAGAGLTQRLELNDPNGNIVAFTLAGRPSLDGGKPLVFDNLAFDASAGSPYFLLANFEGSVTVRPGITRSYALRINRVNGSHGGVHFLVNGLPAGVSGEFQPNPSDGTNVVLALSAGDAAQVIEDLPPVVTVSGEPTTPTAGTGNNIVQFNLYVRTNLTTLTFQDLTDGTVVGTQYQSKGVLFPGNGVNQPVVRTLETLPGRAPNNVADISVGPGEFPAVIAGGEFTQPRRYVALYAGYIGGLLVGSQTAEVTLRAFDNSGQKIGETQPVKVQQGAGFSSLLELNCLEPSIHSFTIAGRSIDNGSPLAFDNLTFDALPVLPPDFTLPDNLAATVIPGGSTQARIVLTPLNGCKGRIGFELRGLPDGISASFSANPTLEFITVLTLTASVTAQPTGDSPAILTLSAVPLDAGAGTTTHTTQVSLLVAPPVPSPSFQLEVDGGATTVRPGITRLLPIRIDRLNGSQGSVSFSMDGLPAGVNGEFQPNPSDGTNVVLALSVGDTGQSNEDQPAVVTVTGAPLVETAGTANGVVQFNLYIRTNITVITFQDLADGTVVGTQYQSKGVFFPGNGINQPIVRTLETLPGRAPNNVADISVGPGEFPPVATRGEFTQLRRYVAAYAGYIGGLEVGSQTAEMTLEAFDDNGQQIAATQPVMVQQGASFGGLLEINCQQPMIRSFTISGRPVDMGSPLAFDNLAFDALPALPPDFSLPANITASVMRGGTNQVTINITRLNGSSGQVSLDIQGLPDGVFAAFSPNPAVGDSSILTLIASAAAQPNGGSPAILTLTATPRDAGAGSAPRTASVTLTVTPNQMVITFEELNDGAVVQDQYRDCGVWFSGDGFNLPVVQTVPNRNPQYAPNNVAVINVGGGEFPDSVCRGEFTQSHRSVSMRVGYLGNLFTGTDTAQMLLTAYGNDGRQIAQSGPVTVNEGAPLDQRLEVSSSQPDIVAFVLKRYNPADQGKPLVFDDLTFDVPLEFLPPDFSLSVPVSAQVLAGGSASVPIEIRRVNGSTGGVSLVASNLPSGVSASFSPNPAEGTATVLTLTAASWVQPNGDTPAFLNLVAVPVNSSAGGDSQAATLPLYIRLAYGIGVDGPQMVNLIPYTPTRVKIAVSRDLSFTQAVSLTADSGHYGGLIQTTFDPPTLDFHDGGVVNESTLTVLASPLYNQQVTPVIVTASCPGMPLQIVSLTVVLDNPFISGFTPAEGQAPQLLRPGTVVTVTGAGFASQEVIYFGNTNAFSIVLDVDADHTVVHARVPRLATDGPLTFTRDRATYFRSTNDFLVHSFRNQQGFSFDNSRDFQTAVGGYGFDDLVELFGVDHTFLIPYILPDPLILAFALTADQALRSGQCFGFALSSTRFQNRDRRYQDYPWQAGAVQPDVWNLQGPEAQGGVSAGLRHYIHIQHMAQLSAEYSRHWLAEASWNLTQASADSVHHDLASAFQGGEAPLLAIRQGTGGHALLAYDLEEGNGPNDYYIDVYDPNRPFMGWENNANNTEDHTRAEQDSRIHIRADNTWTFPMWTDKVETWSGGLDELVLTHYGTIPLQPVPLISVQGILALIFGGAADTGQISDDQGRTLFQPDGAMNTNADSRLPDAAVFAPAGAASDSPAHFYLLGGTNIPYSHTIRGTNDGTYSTTVLSHGYMAQLVNVPINTTFGDTLTFHPVLPQVSLARKMRGLGGNEGTAPPSGLATLSLTARTLDGNARTATLRTSLVVDGQESLGFGVTLDQVHYHHEGAPTVCQLIFNQTDMTGRPHALATSTFAVGPGDSFDFTPQDWVFLPGASMTVVRTDAQGTQTPVRILLLQTSATMTNGHFRLQLPGQIGLRYRVEGSLDLRQWETLDVILNRIGIVEYEDTQISRFPMRFYRIQPQ